MRSSFIVLAALASALLLAPEPAMALRVIHGQVILDKLDDYPNCQNYDDTGSMCHDALKRWVEAHPGDAFKAGKMTRKIMHAWTAVPFFAQAFAQNAGDCKDEDVKLSVIGALDMPADSVDEGVMPQAKKIGFQLCYPDMKADLVGVVDDNRYAAINVCPDLIAKGAVSGLRLAKCQAAK